MLELLMTDRVQEVRLAESDAAADEYRIVLWRVARSSCLRRGERELIRRSGDERVELIARVERRGFRRGERRSRAGRKLCRQARCRGAIFSIRLELDRDVTAAELVQLPDERREEVRFEPETHVAVGCSQPQRRAIPRHELDRTEPHVEILRGYARFKASNSFVPMMQLGHRALGTNALRFVEVDARGAQQKQKPSRSYPQALLELPHDSTQQLSTGENCAYVADS